MQFIITRPEPLHLICRACEDGKRGTVESVVMKLAELPICPLTGSLPFLMTEPSLVRYTQFPESGDEISSDSKSMSYIIRLFRSSYPAGIETTGLSATTALFFSFLYLYGFIY